MTLAPISPRVMVHSGPARTRDRSSTRTPFNARVIMMLSLWLITVAGLDSKAGTCRVSQVVPPLLALVTENHILSAAPAHGRPRASRVRKGVTSIAGSPTAYHIGV